MKPSVRWLYPTAFVCLLLSGAAGLIYQVAWARYLALLLGHASYAVVAVLVAFMGGLALGNAWLGRYADRVARPLALYGWLEIGIALYAVIFPLYYQLCQQAYVAMGSGASPGSPWLLALKYLVSFAMILAPTTLMGGTLPVLTRLVTRSLGELRSRVGGLYFVNSLGAVIGVLLAEFWWIPAMGLDATVYGGAILNVVVGMLALAVSSQLSEDRALAAGAGQGDPGNSPVEAADEAYSLWELRLALVAAGVSGFVAMLYEVVWTRVLALALGSSTHAFSIMLVTFISGIATGAWLIARWRRLRRTFDAFGWAELALAVTLLASMFFYHLLPYTFTRLGSVVARAPANHWIYQGAQFLICFAVMFVPALCLGMTLPLASRVATAELARTGRSVGLVFSVNTIGTVLGAALTGLLFLPALGLARTFALGVGLNFAIALAVLLRRNERIRQMVPWIAPLILLGLIGLTQVIIGSKWTRAFALGLWRLHNPPPSMEAYQSAVDSVDVRFHRDGAGSSVVVHSWTNPADQSVEFTLRVNGKADATSQGDLPTQLLTGHIPLLLRPDATHVLVVGIGSGMTCGAVLTHPGVQRVDAVEISPEVRDAARTVFAPHNQGALDDSRTEVIIDDAKSFLRTSGRRYDVIISEPSNPWMAGVAGVFSLEYYETCRDSLHPGGLMVQWVQIYESNDRTLETVLATFTSVFPFATLWRTLPGDLMLAGSTQPMSPDLDVMQKRFDEPAVTADLRRADIYQLSVLLGLQLVSASNTAFIAPDDTPRHSDYFPVLEYLAERAFFVRDNATLYERLDENLLRRPVTLLGKYLQGHPLTVADAQSFALFHTSYELPHPQLMRSILEHWREMAPDSLLAVEYSAKLEFPLPVSELEASRMARVREELIAGAAEEPEPLRIYSRHLMHAYRYLRSAYYQPPTEELIAVLSRLAEVDLVHRQSHQLRLAEIAWDLGDDARFLQLTTETFVQPDGEPAVGRFDLDYQAPGRVLFLLIETLWRAGRYRDARLWCDAAREGGYLQTSSRLYNPRLNVVVRKVEATVPGEQLAAD
jgi:spermidine synthase